jgi:hypothetical protein
MIVGATNERLEALLEYMEHEVRAVLQREICAAMNAPAWDWERQSRGQSEADIQLELLRKIRVAAELWHAPEPLYPLKDANGERVLRLDPEFCK